MRKPKVDKTKCTGCGTCVALCSDVFEIGEDGKFQVKELDSYEESNIEEAIGSCPEQAISWEGD